MRKLMTRALGAGSVLGLVASSAFAEGEPGAAVLTSLQTAMTGTIGLLVTAAGVIVVAGLGIWAAPFIARKVKRFVTAGA